MMQTLIQGRCTFDQMAVNVKPSDSIKKLIIINATLNETVHIILAFVFVNMLFFFTTVQPSVFHFLKTLHCEFSTLHLAIVCQSLFSHCIFHSHNVK